ncbi:hypothetical protein LTR09_002507 [Extremus antarcticus]|uniref:Uncharacterized protein n=1 Tax=Extremus antarcticus TaxID=702011 RepID=A0AAJ0GFU9_9PEZI|nr:hypothetical protein LTR09_002507 [Extremus antarcticus]
MEYHQSKNIYRSRWRTEDEYGYDKSMYPPSHDRDGNTTYGDGHGNNRYRGPFGKITEANNSIYRPAPIPLDLDSHGRMSERTCRFDENIDGGPLDGEPEYGVLNFDREANGDDAYDYWGDEVPDYDNFNHAGPLSEDPEYGVLNFERPNIGNDAYRSSGDRIPDGWYRDRARPLSGDPEYGMLRFGERPRGVPDYTSSKTVIPDSGHWDHAGPLSEEPDFGTIDFRADRDPDRDAFMSWGHDAYDDEHWDPDFEEHDIDWMPEIGRDRTPAARRDAQDSGEYDYR